MATSVRLTIHDLEGLPQPLEDKRYELIDGELYVSTQPSWQHQSVCSEVTVLHGTWSKLTGAGMALFAPGLVFAVDEAVAPDVVWVSKERMPHVLAPDGRLRAAPDLVVEVLSPGSADEQRDRDIKLALYSRRGVREYWIVGWQQRALDAYRRGEDAALHHAATLYEEDTVHSPLLPGFTCRVADLLAGLP
ncbi:MAG: Uma2 family endonuclease [Chloroflexi bacterium]|nr:Uma2 family endonuclease [Chloroflexota bacterium]